MGKRKQKDGHIQRVLSAFESSGLTRREFCQRHHLSVSTLDYWRRARARQSQLVEVQVAAADHSADFTLHLVNGRWIESAWEFADTDLARLIRVAETA